MTTSPGRGLSIRAGVLLGAIAVLAAGCTAAYRGNPPRAERAGAAHVVTAARSSGRGFAHRSGGTAGPGSGFRPAQAPSLAALAPWLDPTRR